MGRMTLHSRDSMDMVHGPLLRQLVSFAVPIMLSALLQLLFNAADIAVVGRFTGSDALAAVSASGPISNAIVSLFMGLSVGANVLCAQCVGGHRDEDLHETIHTAVAISVMIGLTMMALGLSVASALLRALGTPEEILPLARRYLLIFFCGLPSTMLYNFGAAILRALGNTRRPLLYLTISGALNVCLNLFFVIVLHMGVEGVAIATVIAQTLSASMVMTHMVRSDAMYHLDIKGIRIYKDKFVRILKIGIPAGIQSSAFSISNLLIQSAVNSFGAKVMAASAAAINVESFCNVALDALSQAAISFTGQNYGAGNLKRIDHILLYAVGLGCLWAITLGSLAYQGSSYILSIYTNDPHVIAHGREIMFIICHMLFVNCVMNIPFNVIRGMDHSIFPMVSTIFCVCGLRVVWIYTIFASFRSLTVLYLSYPVTKGLAAVTAIVYYLWLRKAVRRKKTALL